MPERRFPPPWSVEATRSLERKSGYNDRETWCELTEAAMWVFAILIAVATIYFGAHDVALAQATIPNGAPPPLLGTTQSFIPPLPTVPNTTPPFQGLSTPVTSTVTNCMMLCNSQLANCQTACLIPPPPALAGTFAGQQLARSVTLNSTSNTACSIGCTSN